MSKIVKRLEPPDSLHLQAAEGWLELGDHLEANEELEKIEPELRAHPDALEIRWQIFAKEMKWEACVEIARSLTNLAPDRPYGWVHLAFSLRRAQGGGLETALATLLPVVTKLPKIWMIPYNLACYCAQLNRLDEAQMWFKKSMEIDEQTVKRHALDDPDLKPLWDSMSGSLWKKT